MEKHKQRHRRDGTGRGELTRIDVWCGNNDAIEHRQNWDSRKRSYFSLSFFSSRPGRGDDPWTLSYFPKFNNRWLSCLRPGNLVNPLSPEYFAAEKQSKQSLNKNIPKEIPENPHSFMWKCPRCKRVYQLNLKILEPYLDKLILSGQSRVSAAHLEAVQAEILHAKQAEATDNNRP